MVQLPGTFRGSMTALSDAIFVLGAGHDAAVQAESASASGWLSRNLGCGFQCLRSVAWNLRHKTLMQNAGSTRATTMDQLMIAAFS